VSETQNLTGDDTVGLYLQPGKKRRAQKTAREKVGLFVTATSPTLHRSLVLVSLWAATKKKPQH